jgi:hypothetical protein
VFAGKKVRKDNPAPVPEIDRCELMEDARTFLLERIVTMKSTSYRRNDQVHLLESILVGLTDEGWLERFSPGLRLQELLDDPAGSQAPTASTRRRS